MTWLKSHHWVSQPYFKTERRKVLDTVRTPTYNAALFDKKYYDIDTGRFKFDKLHTLSSTSLADIESDYGATTHERPRYRRTRNDNSWFKPLDDDFDEECRVEELEKEEKEEEYRKVAASVINPLAKTDVDREKVKLSLVFEVDNYNQYKLKPGEEIMLINGKPVLDENGDVKIFRYRI